MGKIVKYIKRILLALGAVFAAILAIRNQHKKELGQLIKLNKEREKNVRTRIKELQKDSTTNKKEIAALKRELKVIEENLKKMDTAFETGDEAEAEQFLKDFLNKQ